MTQRVRLNGERVTIDKGIVNVVKKMNECGFKTIASCSSLREDHPPQHPRDCSCDPYVLVAGKPLELIDIAEASGWDWRFEGEHMSFFSNDGQVYKGVERALTKPLIAPDGRPVHWDEKRTPSSKEEAIQSQFSVKFTQLVLERKDLTNDEVVKEGIAHLLEAITQKCISVCLCRRKTQARAALFNVARTSSK